MSSNSDSKKETAVQLGQHKQAILSRLPGHHGNVSNTCRSMGISRNTYYNYCLDDPAFKEAAELAIIEGRESKLDLVEDAILTSALGSKVKEENEDGDMVDTEEWLTKPNVIAQLFILKCQGKHRGYREGEAPPPPPPSDEDKPEAKDGIREVLDEYFKEMKNADKTTTKPEKE